MKNNNIFLRIWNNPNFRSYSGLILVIFIVSIFLNFRSDNFLTLQNILNVLRQISVYGILACGMAFSMITAGIDLTVGSVAGVCGAIVTKLVVETSMPLYPAIFLGIVSGGFMGYISGFLIAKTGIPPFIMTLGMQISLRGVAYLVCNGKPIGNLPDNMLFLGLGNVFGIPVPIFFMIAVFIIVGVILSKTSFGRSVYAVGGNYRLEMHPPNQRRAILLKLKLSPHALWAVFLLVEEKELLPVSFLGHY